MISLTRPAHVGERARAGPALARPRDLRGRADRHPDAALGRADAAAGRDRAAARRDRSPAASSAALTDIDWALARHFFERLLARLSLIWTDVVGLSLKLEPRRPAPGDRADGLGVRADAVDDDRGAPGRHLRDAGAAAPVVGDRAGGRALRRARRRAEDARDASRPCGGPSAASRSRSAPRSPRSSCRSRPCSRSSRATCSSWTPRRRRRHALRRQGARPPGQAGPSGSRRAVQVTDRVARRRAMSADDALIQLGSPPPRRRRRARDVRRRQGLAGDVAVARRERRPARWSPPCRAWRRASPTSTA